MMTSPKMWIPVAAFAGVLVLAGCGGGTTSAAPPSSPAAAGGHSAMPTGLTKNQQRGLIDRQCMESKGWKGTPMNGGVMYQTQGQQAAFDQASAECQKVVDAQLPIPKLTPPQIKELYAKELATVECLRKNGLPTPDGPPISEQQYVSEYYKGPSWNAYKNVQDVTTAEKVCPQPDLDEDL